jgi:hypothetical protein
MTLTETLTKYNSGYNSGAVNTQLQAAMKKFGLSEEEVAAGLDAFGKTTQRVFGTGFTPYSALTAIGNGAIQNALNAKVQPDFLTNPDNWKQWTAETPVANAMNYGMSPEQVTARASSERAANLAGNVKLIKDQVSGTQDSFWSGIGKGYGGAGQWTDEAITRLAQLGVDSGLMGSNFIKAVDDVSKAHPNDTAWWGPDAYIQSLATSRGGDPAKYVDAAKLQRDQAQTASVGNKAQADNTRGSWVGDAAKIAGFLGAGIGLGGLSSLSEGALASQLAAEGSSGLGAATSVGSSSGFSIPSLLGDNSLTGITSGNPLVDNALTSAVKTGVTGGDPLKGGLSSLVTNGLTTALPDTGIGFIDKTINGAIGGGVGAAVNGGDVGTGITNGLTSGAVNGAINGIGNSIVGSFTPNGNVNENPIEQSNTISSNNPITDNNPMIPNTGGTDNMPDEWNFSDSGLTDTIDQTWNQEVDMSGYTPPDTSGMFDDPTGGLSSGNGMTSGTDFDPTGGVSSSGGITSNTTTSGATNNGFWSSLAQAFNKPGTSGNSGLGGILGALGTYFGGSKTASAYSDLQKALLAAGDVSQRPGAQWALGQAQKYVGPQGQADYVSGFANPIMASYAQHLPSSIAKSGDLTGSMNKSMTDMGAAISGNYNGFVNSLLGATGTTQPNAGIGAAGQAGATGINQQQTGNNALINAAGNIAGNVANNIFNTPTASGTSYVGA